ncbi:transporter substrate-binding domain-containing protein [Bacteroides ihuae]|uniref:transporter substrate-binding domain-containing protein n=1 Tax=Bacteroides ihuae TaxID=1852362 RepID=UPI0008DA68CE|nr:transporter substrate-binding domain-containing protein [Bacteroides ihuae]
MTLPKSRLLKYFILGILSVLIASLWFHKKEEPQKSPRDYNAIKAEGIIRVATEYNSIGYYTDGDSISGFHYELINAFAKQNGLKAEIIPEMSYQKRLQGLSNGTFDIIGYGIQSTSELQDSLLLTIPIFLSKQVLVQRKAVKGDSTYIRNQLDLAGKTLYVIKGSPSILRIQNLGNEIGDTIFVKEIDKYGPEQLLAMVAHGDIKYAVCNEDIARAEIDSFPQLDINTDISFTQFYSWGVSKKSPVLLIQLNTWLKTFSKSKDFQRIYHKYYGKQH